MPDGALEPASEPDRALRVATHEHRHELVAAGPHQHVRRAQFPHHRRGEAGEQRVTRRVTVDVVDRLETVDVDCDDGEALAAELGEPVREDATVADSGEWVGACQRLGPHVRGSVGKRQGANRRKTS